MRLNRFIATNLGVSRRQADKFITNGQVKVNGEPAILGIDISDNDQVLVNGQIVKPKNTYTYLLLNKPVGYICSRNGQGSRTIYDLLTSEFKGLKPAGRLDKDSSGLVLLTDDGQMIYDLTHPKGQKYKVYEALLDKILRQADLAAITSGGVTLSDGLSKFDIEPLPNDWLKITMQEGRNRQIRRTFEALGYKVKKLNRTQIGPYNLNDIKSGAYLITDIK